MKYKIHPLAGAYRMLGDDELSSLAADIAANGLLEPISVDDDGLIVDGRNRLKACEMAGVEPRFEKLNGIDVRAFVLAKNSERRHISKGQLAMAAAFLYPQPTKYRRGGKSSKIEGLAKGLISEARTVFREAPDLAEAVKQGTTALKEAYDEVLNRRKIKTSAEAMNERLGREAPDLVDLVPDRMSLAEAIAALDQRQKDQELAEHNKRETLARLTEAAYRGLAAWSVDGFVADFRERMSDDEFRQLIIQRTRAAPDEIARLRDGATALVEILNDMMGEDR